MRSRPPSPRRRRTASSRRPWDGAGSRCSRVVLLLLLAALWRPNAALVIVVLGMTGWMSVARLVYGEVRSLGVRPFVEGARALGASRSRVLGRHILPNALTPVIVAAALGVGNAIML